MTTEEVIVINDLQVWASSILNNIVKQMDYLAVQAKNVESGSARAKSIEMYYNLLSDCKELTEEFFVGLRLISNLIERNKFLETEYMLNKEKTDLRVQNQKLKSELFQLNKFINIQRETIAKLTDRVHKQ